MSFTESCLAVAIVSTTMAIAVPSLARTRETYVLQSEARHVAAAMHAARVAAISRNRDCRLVVTTAVSYQIECQGATWDVVETMTMSQGLTLSANGRPEFHKRGSVSPAATFQVCSPRRCLQVIVNINGRVRIQ